VVQLPLVAWLAIMWSLLWGTFTPGNLISGLVVGLVLTLAFPLPPLDIGLRFHPAGIVRLVARFSKDLVLATLRVSGQILSPGPLPCAILELPLRSRSDLMLTVTTLVVQSVPGSTVVEIRRETSTLYLHVLGAGDEAAMEAAQREVLEQEERVVRAFGTAEQIARFGGAGGERGGRRAHRGSGGARA